MAAETHASRYDRWSQILHIVSNLFARRIFSLAILPLQLGNDASRSTANVASYNVAKAASVWGWGYEEK